MILTFSVYNFRSFLERETLRLTSGSEESDKVVHLVPLPNHAHCVLRTAVVYGANGAGKSNLFKALCCLRALAVDSRGEEALEAVVPFAFLKKHEAPQGTVFDLQFVKVGQIYRYCVVVTAERTIGEELLSKIVDGQEQVVFRRTTAEEAPHLSDIQVGHLGNEPLPKRLEALTVVGAAANKTFLDMVAESLDVKGLPDDFRSPIEWFRDDLCLVSPTSAPQNMLSAYQNDRIRQIAADLLTAATGVSQMVMEAKPMTKESLSEALPPEHREQVLADLARAGNAATLVIGSRGHREEIGLLKDASGDGYVRMEMRAEHPVEGGKSGRLRLTDESDGTQRLVQLIPLLYLLLEQHKVVVIDEIERSMHPLLCQAFLKYFLHAGNAGQLLLMTHADGLLDDQLLRRDEVWFVEKDTASRSHLYALDEYRKRTQATLREYYFQGRYGAIPFGFNVPNGEPEEAAQ